MFKRKLINTSWCKLQKRHVQNVAHAKGLKNEHSEITKIRNIGILAHIDAGKTTTTERMLYYSGLIKSMGEVHHGNTVTDYMDQERQRGITITSASVTFPWKNYQINLIDTPGHIDFTMEVEQALRVLDGAVVILDGTAGVEAQTVTVCRQVEKYDIPKIVYVNKMDRPDGDFDMSLKSIETKLNLEVLPIQFPIKNEGNLDGLVDVLTLEKLMYNQKDKGMNYTRVKLSESKDKHLWEIANERRINLIDKLSNMDDKLANIIIEQETMDNISADCLVDSLQTATLKRKGVPVLLGSSYKNMGVQPLMDSMLLYLPSPNQNQYSRYYNGFGNDLSAKVFKIVHDKNKGPITFFRIYSGVVKKRERIYNVQRETSEQIGKLYVVCADDFEEINSAGPGNIIAATGLRSTVTGDLLASSPSAAGRARTLMERQKNISPEVVENLFAPGSRILEPVFFCSIEPPSLASQRLLDTALQELEREDPSLRVTQDTENGQTILGGMGELHIEIIKERIRSEYKIDADIGPLQIGYRETIRNMVKDTYVFDQTIGSKTQKVTVTMSLIPNYNGKEILLLDRSAESAQNIDSISPKVMQMIKNGLTNVLLHGPKLCFPVKDVGVKLHWLDVAHGTTLNGVSAAVSHCVRKLMQDATVLLLEPIMDLEIIAPEEYVPVVLADLSKKGAEVRHIDVRGRNKVIESFAPLSELLGYATSLRIITSGNATFSLKFSHYQEMDATREAEAIKKTTGFV